MNKEAICDKCGRCITVCPSYQYYLNETMSPRARLDLMEAVAQKELPVSPRYEESMQTCLQCLACTEICSKGVGAANRILFGKAKLAQSKVHSKKLNLKTRLEHGISCQVLGNRKVLRAFLSVASLGQKLFKKDQNLPIRHLPNFLSELKEQRSLPNISTLKIKEFYPAPKSQTSNSEAYLGSCASAPFAPASHGSEKPKINQVKNEMARHANYASYSNYLENTSYDVALFTGCFAGIINSQTTINLIAILNLLGYSVHIPKAQTCCGAPAKLSGFINEPGAKKIDLKNTQAFLELFLEKGDLPILTSCATCHKNLSYYQETKIAHNLQDAMAFLSKALTSSGLKVSDLEHKITIHDPCHLRLQKEAGASLRRIFDNIIEVEHQGQCCGGGGITSLKNPELAYKLGQARAKELLATGADYVLAECPGCLLQLNHYLQGTGMQAMHPIDYLHKLLFS